MADFSLIELKQNDELTDVVRKSNSNFKNLGYALKKKLQGAADSSSAEWKQAIADLTKDMNQKVSDLTTELAAAEETMAKMVPPVGSTLIMPRNPSTMYPGTTWSRYGQMHPLMWGGTDRAKYMNPVDADGNALNAAGWVNSSSATTGAYALVAAWHRTA